MEGLQRLRLFIYYLFKGRMTNVVYLYKKIIEHPRLTLGILKNVIKSDCKAISWEYILNPFPSNKNLNSRKLYFYILLHLIYLFIFVKYQLWNG